MNKTKYFYTGIIYQDENKIEKYFSPFEGEIQKFNFKTKKYYTSKKAKKKLKKEILQFLKEKPVGDYVMNLSLMKYDSGYRIVERNAEKYLYNGNSLKKIL